jgi:hypothetical protein
MGKLKAAADYNHFASENASFGCLLLAKTTQARVVT